MSLREYDDFRLRYGYVKMTGVRQLLVHHVVRVGANRHRSDCVGCKLIALFELYLVKHECASGCAGNNPET